MPVRALVAAVSASSVLVVAALAAAQDDGALGSGRSDRLTLNVHGSARVPADRIDLELVVEGRGEDGAIAEKRHRDKLRQVVRALEELRESFRADETGRAEPPLPVEVVEGRSMIGIARAGGNEAVKGEEVTVATAVVVRLEGIAAAPRPRLLRRLAKILDTALEAGAGSGIGGNGTRPAFRFRARDNEALRAAAHEDALVKGRARAARLARLGGRELGPLSTIAEASWTLRSGNVDAVGFDAVVGRLGNNKLNNHEMTTSTTEIELEVQLTLEFDLGKTAASTEQAR